MNRRKFGALLVFWPTLLMTGCVRSRTQSATQTTTRTSTTAVSVTKRIEAGQTGLVRTLTVRDGGTVLIELTCPNGTMESATGEIPAEDWKRFKQLILETDPTTLRAAYKCDSSCPSDIPPVQLTFIVNKRKTDIEIEAGADHPESLATIRSQLTAFADRIETPSCTGDM